MDRDRLPLYEVYISTKLIEVQNGDVLWVDRAPMVYIYGEVQRPGAFRLAFDERGERFAEHLERHRCHSRNVHVRLQGRFLVEQKNAARDR